MKIRSIFTAVTFVLFAIATLDASPPATLTYQGKLKTAQGVRVNGQTKITCRIYDVATGGTKLWEEVFPNVTVTDGIFKVILGKTTSLASLPFDKTYYISMEVNTDGEMTPRMEMTSAPYAINTVKQSAAGAAESMLRSISMPKNVVVNPSGSGQVVISWNAVDSASSYNIYLATESGVNASNYTSKANGKAITGVTSPYTVTGLTSGITYYFSVVSVTPVGESIASLEAKATAADKIINSLGMEFKLIPSGTFTMGSPTSEIGHGDNETQHSVKISKAFYMQTTEVTQGQWKEVMGRNPSYFSSCGETCPVENISYIDIQDFLDNLNKKGEGIYRLPTEAEWEYAARAGTTKSYSFGDSSSSLGDYAWYSSNSSSKTHPVASKLPNPWGLYDIHGNVWEWVSDWYGSYSSSPATDPVGPTSGSYHVFRGGSWYNAPDNLRSALRGDYNPGSRDYTLVGFRLATVP